MNKRRVVLISGGSKGIGAACTKSFLKSGESVLILSRSLGEFAGSEYIQSGQLLHLPVNFEDMASINETCLKVENDFNVEVLINNSGGPKSDDLINFDETDFLKGFTSHLFASQALLKTVVKGMKTNNYGRVINIVSVTATIPLPRMGVSNTVRGAMINWSKTASKELAKYNITVNNILPGYTETQRLIDVVGSAADSSKVSYEEYSKTIINQIPAGRFGRPEEIAYAVKCLANKDASFINGVSIPVDGGWTVSI